MGGSMSKILDGVYIGNLHDATDEEEMQKNGITHVLAVHDNARPLLIHKTYLCINASDSFEQDLYCHFPKCNDFIHNARMLGGGVLVHCLAGVSRSATIVVAYVMTMTGLDWRSAFIAVQSARSYVNPNFNFQRQLLKYQHELCDQEAERLTNKFGESSFGDRERCRHLVAESLKREESARRTPSTVSSSNSYPFAPSASRRLPDYEERRYMAEDGEPPAASATDVLRAVVRAKKLGKEYDRATPTPTTPTSSTAAAAAGEEGEAGGSGTGAEAAARPKTDSERVEEMFAASKPRSTSS